METFFSKPCILGALVSLNRIQSVMLWSGELEVWYKDITASSNEDITGGHYSSDPMLFGAIIPQLVSAVMGL